MREKQKFVKSELIKVSEKVSTYKCKNENAILLHALVLERIRGRVQFGPSRMRRCFEAVHERQVATALPVEMLYGA